MGVTSTVTRISNSILVSTSGTIQAGENECRVCGIYLSLKPSPEGLQSDDFPFAVTGTVLLLSSMFCFPYSHPIKAYREMNFELSKIDIF